MSSLRLVPPGGAPIDVPGDRALIGRDPGADIVVNDPSVSRRHALLERRPEGWVVYDQRSANGTWVNEQRVDQSALQNGLQLRLGAVTFGVMLPAGAGGPQPQPGYPPQPYGAPAYAPPGGAGYPGAPGPPGYPPPGGPAPVYAPPAAARPGYPAPAYPPGPPGTPAYPPAAPSYPSTIPPPGSASVYTGGPPAPAYPPSPGGYGAPGPAPQRPPAAAPAAGGMSEAEAAEILGLWPGSPSDEVRRRYQKLYNDFQIRLTNAPTPSLKKMYQKNIQDLKIACDIICPGVVI